MKMSQSDTRTTFPAVYHIGIRLRMVCLPIVDLFLPLASRLLLHALVEVCKHHTLIPSFCDGHDHSPSKCLPFEPVSHSSHYRHFDYSPRPTFFSKLMWSTLSSM